MLEVFGRHLLLTSVVLLLVLCGIVCQIMIGVLYQNMIRATENMTATEHKLLKHCKLKFMNCYKMNAGVVNVQVFVDRFLTKIRIAGLSMNGIAHLGNQLILLSVFVNGIGICKMIADKKGIVELIPFYVLSILSLYVYFCISSFVDAAGRYRELKINLTDYLENHMVNRLRGLDLSQIRQNQELMEKEEQEEKTGTVTQIEEASSVKKSREKRKEERLEQQEEKELQSLLQEFFLT